MAQLWVNLPAKDKGAAPRYQSILKEDIPVVVLPDDAGSVRVIAGEFDGNRGPAKTFTPINLWDIHLKSGKSAKLFVEDGHTTALLICRGSIQIDGRSAAEGALVNFDREGTDVVLQASADSHVMLMSGEPLQEPIVGQGPFVMNTQAEIRQAFQDFQQGAMGSL